jgi:hypothetical protein
VADAPKSLVGQAQGGTAAPAKPLATPPMAGASTAWNQSAFEKALRENLPRQAAEQLIALSKRVK